VAACAPGRCRLATGVIFCAFCVCVFRVIV
jgi:hypothetical protein